MADRSEGRIAASRSGTNGPLLEVARLSKRFGAIEALRDVSLTLDAGEVLAVVGENGAGKSTLIKILAGIHRPDGGTVWLRDAADEASAAAGVRFAPASPAESMARGIAVIHQELHLADNLSIAANLFLGREPLRWRALGWIDRRRMEALARGALEQVGLDRDPRQAVAALSPAERQLVEIARALAMEARVVVMDEPTSSLGRAEASTLLERVEDLRRRGIGVLYVSHRLGEVIQVADRAVVLRDGRVAGELGRGALDARSLLGLMAGRERDEARDPVQGERGLAGSTEGVASRPVETGVAASIPALAVRALRLEPGAPALSFEVGAGEILGLFGLQGAGRTELLEALFGLRRAAAGSIEVAGGAATPGSTWTAARGSAWTVGRAIAAGLALVPEDRKTQSLVAEMTVAENLALASLAGRPLYARRSRSAERERALALCRELDVRPPDPAAAVGRLSGGNQQKVALGKWLARSPHLLLLDEPTRGVDVGAREEIHHRLRALAASGVAIVLSSAETDEVLALSDRVLVLRRGEIAGVLAGDDRSEEALLGLAAGGAAPAADRAPVVDGREGSGT